MNSSSPRETLKELLGLIAGSAELYQKLRPGVVPSGSYPLTDLEANLSGWIDTTQTVEPWIPEDDRRHVLIIGNLKWWLEYGIAIGLLMKTGGHSVDLAYLPYRDWTTPVSRFDAERGAQHIRQRLQRFRFPLRLRSLLEVPKERLEGYLEKEMEAQARIDVQYTMQREDIDVQGETEDAALYKLRLERNRRAAASADTLFAGGKYDVVIIPNGSILEFGAVFRVANYRGVPVVTYEFGEQRERLWLARNDEVMKQDTTALWQAVGDVPIIATERREIEELFNARRGGRTWAHFSRQWQSAETEGAQQARQKLGLDPNRPIVLLCTNVVGDSLALKRQVFTSGMAEWLRETVAFFGNLPDYQLVVRVHPGEMLGAGHPSVEIIKDTFPDQPEHVVVVPPESEINSYDLIDLADLGLVYTTTIGLEMCMLGVPVIVSGETHYKGKGFTDDPQSWDEYIDILKTRLRDLPELKLPERAVGNAWRYAYRYFFDYPFEFPWHLITFWEDLATNPLSEVIRAAENGAFQNTLNTFAGNPIDWRAKIIGSEGVEVMLER